MEVRHSFSLFSSLSLSLSLSLFKEEEEEEVESIEVGDWGIFHYFTLRIRKLTGQRGCVVLLLRYSSLVNKRG